MSTTLVHVKRIIISTVLGLIAIIQPSWAQTYVRNTYNGAECVSVFSSDAYKLTRNLGIAANAPVTVVCPVVKAIYNSTGPVTVAVAASGGTQCRLESIDVFNLSFISSAWVTFPGTAISGIDISIPRSYRGGMQVRCNLQVSDTILNYLAREQ